MEYIIFGMVNMTAKLCINGIFYLTSGVIKVLYNNKDKFVEHVVNCKNCMANNCIKYS